MATIDQNKIRRTSKIIRGFALALLIILPLMLAWYWTAPLQSETAELGLSFSSSTGLVEDLREVGYLSPASLTAQKKLLGFLISLFPMIFLYFAIFHVYRLLGYFVQGVYIASGTVKALKMAAYGLIFFMPAAVLSETLLGLALTLGNPPGQRLLTIGVSSSEILTLFIGAFVLMITKAFHVEKERAEEHASIV